MTTSDFDTDLDPVDLFQRRSARYLARRTLRRTRELLGDSPVFLPVVLRATPLGTSRRITVETQMVIEGFPRSGNTFASHAFRLANPGVRLTSHVHTPSQVKEAVHHEVPTLVVLRDPVPTIVSLLIAAPWVRIPVGINEYIHHHQQIIPYGYGFQVATFEEVTADFGAVTRQVNQRFGTDFTPFHHVPEQVDAVFASIEDEHRRVHGGTETGMPRPSGARDPARTWLHEQLAQPRYRAQLAEAHAVHQACLGLRRCEAAS